MIKFSKILSGLAGIALAMPLVAAGPPTPLQGVPPSAIKGPLTSVGCGSVLPAIPDQSGATTLPTVPASCNALTPPGPGWNDHLYATVDVYMGNSVPPDSIEPITFSVSYGPSSMGDQSHPNKWGWPNQTLDITTTGGTLAATKVTTNADGWASDALTGVKPGQTVDVTAYLDGGPVAGIGVTTGVAQSGGGKTSTTRIAPTVPTKKPTPTPKVVPAIPTPTLKIVAPTRQRVGQAIPATITILRNGEPDVHALVTIRASTGRLSRTSGLTNAQGQIHVVITHAPAGRLAIIATTDRAHGRAVVHVIADPFPWWDLLLLIGLVLIGILTVVASVRQRRRWPHR